MFLEAFQEILNVYEIFPFLGEVETRTGGKRKRNFGGKTCSVRKKETGNKTSKTGTMMDNTVRTS